MQEFKIQKAEQVKKPARVFIDGPSKSGKTFTSLALATFIAQGKGVICGDSENMSSSHYAARFDFNIVGVNEYSLDNYLNLLSFLRNQAHGCAVLDSISHAWAGEGGAIEEVDAVTDSTPRKKAAGKFYSGWRVVTPKWHRLMSAITHHPQHIICCSRSKTEYTSDSGKIEAVGTVPIVRADFEYEFDFHFRMSNSGTLTVIGSRFDAFSAGETVVKPDDKFFSRVLACVEKGTREAEPPPFAPAPQKLRDEYDGLAEQMKKAGKDPKPLPASATTAKAMEWIGHAKAWLDKKGEHNVAE